MDKFYRYVVQVEVLADRELDDDTLTNLHHLNYEIMEGQSSGRTRVIDQEEVPPHLMAQLLISQGSDPEFFRIDEFGNPVDDQEYDDALDDLLESLTAEEMLNIHGVRSVIGAASRDVIEDKMNKPEDKE